MNSIGIIGGNGGMGCLFSSVFSRAGYEVSVSGRNTRLSNRDLAESCDIVMVSVPIRATVGVIDEIAPVMKPEQVLCDLTSVKTMPVQAMLKSKASVIGFHPMFGPKLPGIRGQNIVATPARCPDEILSIFTSIFASEGAQVTIMTPEEHDRVVAVVQGLVHFATLAVADAVRTSGTDFEKILSVMSPVYRIEMGLIGRILGQSSDLYGDILRMNPEVMPVLNSFSDSVENLRESVASTDEKEFQAFFNGNRECFDEYIPLATRDTDALIEALVNLT
ncbi:prephenate dehydrogenase/arogenate dehydrogenase family protein [Methanolacinia petrolearia]|uniref:prephenate dehydrogenase/arogenate dehydrogenase family protein n=1 Tax=Methanolacinia petrolearia TaxID=54120 RepID=UPI003BADA1F7